MSVTAGGHIYEIKSGQHDNTTIHDSVLHFPRSDGVGYMASIVTGPKPAQSNSNQLQAPTNVDAMHVLCLIYQKLPRAIIANVPRCITLALNFMPTWGLTLIRKATASASREWCKPTHQCIQTISPGYEQVSVRCWPSTSSLCRYIQHLHLHWLRSSQDCSTVLVLAS